jgi:hypothetical protein
MFLAFCIVGGVLMAAALLAWACCVVAGRADRQMEERC